MMLDQDKKLLQLLVPINALTPQNFAELADKTVVERTPAGAHLFRAGDTDNESIFLLAGKVTLSSADGGVTMTVPAGSDEARYALAQLKPRQYTGVADTEATIARVDSKLLDRLLTWDQLTGYEVVEYGGAEDGEWMLQILRNKAFERLPPENVNAMFAHVEALPVKAGEVIVRQGESGDYYYMIKEGRCSVSRKSDKTGKVAMLGNLSAGDSFGEEALLTGAPRNANVIMLTDGVLMRLAKKDFDEALKGPMVHYVGLDQARAMLKEGACLIDVRLEDEFRRGAIKGSINIPVYLLRLKAKGLEPGRKYVVYCQTGSRSAAAAFLLEQRGFDVSVLQGGLDGLGKNAARGGMPESS